MGGVLAHLPMFFASAHHGYRMAGMEMDMTMMVGMCVMPFGLLLATYGLMPRLAALRAQSTGEPAAMPFHQADHARLNSHHWRLVAVLVVALAVDVLKPATLGFVMPGMTREYGISDERAGLLALVALFGTTVGSVLWGRLADRLGRRAAILLSALMFIGTAICGAMPSFEWNLAMCFLMGASAGGLLPIAFTLMAETVPAAHRGWLLVALGGVGTSAGYLLAAGSAAWLEPLYSWRALWLLGLPTGFLIIFLNRYIPESPRFLANVGLGRMAEGVLGRFAAGPGAVKRTTIAPGAAHPATAALDEEAGMRALLRGHHGGITVGLIVCGIGWGLVNFGFLLWLPTNLGRLGMDAGAASALLTRSAVLALPGIAVVIWLYHRWSSIGALILFIALTTATLVAFWALGALHVRSPAAMTLATACLLVSSSGVIAMLIPYASEIYPVGLRGTGSGIVAASSKFGGILGAALGVAGFFGDFAVSALLLALPLALSACMLWRSGVETRGHGLEEIQARMRGGGARGRDAI